MAALTRQTITTSGLAVTYASASGGGDTVANPTSTTALLVLNGDGSPTTVTIPVPGNAWNGVAAPDTAVVVAAGATALIRLDKRYATNGVASITYSSVTSLSVAYVAL